MAKMIPDCLVEIRLNHKTLAFRKFDSTSQPGYLETHAGHYVYDLKVFRIGKG